MIGSVLDCSTVQSDNILIDLLAEYDDGGKGEEEEEGVGLVGGCSSSYMVHIACFL